MARLFLTSLCLSLFLAVPASADDWPQFQGPTRNGVSTEGKLALSWPKSGPRELWSLAVGVGFGGASISKGEVFILDRVEDERDVLRCLDLAEGKELWRFEYLAPGRLSYNGSRTVPTVEGGRIYSFGPFGDLCCFDRATHKLIWRKNLRKVYGGNPGRWGYSQSPLVHKDLVYLAPMGRKVGMVAFNKKTGDEVWTSGSLGAGSYASPMLRSIGGVEQVTFLGKGGLTSLDPATGKLLWKYRGYVDPLPIPAATDLGEGRFFLTGGYGGGSAFIEVVRTGGGFEVKQLQRIRGRGAQIHPALLHNGYLFANFNNNGNIKRRPESLVCIGPDGSFKWKTEGKPHIDRGPLLLAGDLLLSLGGEDGLLRLIRPSPNGYQELASAQVFKGLRRSNNMIWAPMALSGGKLVLRNQKLLKCLDLSGEEGPKAGKRRGF